MSPPVDLRARAQKLGLVGLLDHWEEVAHLPSVEDLVTWEEQHRQRRSLERRISSARLPRFRSMTEFDWTWPKVINQPFVRDLMGLRFIAEGANVILIGPNGVGKSMIAYNIAHQALLHSNSVMCTNASQMLNSSRVAASNSQRRSQHLGSAPNGAQAQTASSPRFLTAVNRLLELSTAKLKISKDDAFGLLLATCTDCIGAVEIYQEQPDP